MKSEKRKPSLSVLGSNKNVNPYIFPKYRPILPTHLRFGHN